MNRAVDDDDDDEFWDLLVSLCAHCELIRSSETDTTTLSPKTTLQTSYQAWRNHHASNQEKISLMMEQNIDLDNDDDDDTTFSHDTASTLRRHEELLSELHVALDNYYAWVGDEMNETIKDLKALEESPRPPNEECFLWILWIQRMVRDWRQRMDVERQAWRKWQETCLVTAYSGRVDPLDPTIMLQSNGQHLGLSDKVMLTRLTLILEGLDDEDSKDSIEDSTKTILRQHDPEQPIFETKKDIGKSEVAITSDAKILDSSNLQQTVRAYFATSTAQPSNRFVLLTGEPGSGKSYMCQQIRQDISQNFPSVTILAPRIPLDFLGRTVGGAEATWWTLLTAVARADDPVLVVLDSVDDFVEDENVTGGSLSNRLAAGWRVFLDAILTTTTTRTGSPVLVLGTCTKVSEANKARVDAVFDCRNPSDEARRAFLCTATGVRTDDVDAMDTLTRRRLDAAVEAALGRSYGEMAFQVRQVLSKSQTVDLSPANVLDELRHQFQQHCPPSLSTGATDGIVDMQVLTTSELGVTTATRQHPGGLYGKEMEDAWRSLQASVIIPLCRSGELQRLLGTKGDRRTMTGGVLLSGPPGCGKTALANEAARYVASIDPSIKFINVSCTSLVHKEVGGSEKALHQLFVAVRQAAPCILLLEGIETIAAVRGHDNTTDGTMDRVLSTLLVELDGVDSQRGSAAPFAAIGTTHNHRWVDPALIRPGRLGAVLSLGLPDESTRKEIIHSSLEGCECSATVLERINEKTRGMSGASVVSLCNDLKLKFELTMGPSGALSTDLFDMFISGRR